MEGVLAISKVRNYQLSFNKTTLNEKSDS